MTTDGVASTSIMMTNPTNRLTIETGAGTDSVSIDGFGTSASGFNGGLLIDGGGGVDSISITTDLTLGNANLDGNLTVSAEAISISGDVDTRGGNADGDVV